MVGLTKKKLFIIIGLFLLIGVLLVASLLQERSPEQIFAGKYDNSWHEAIEDLGGDMAYELFVQINDKQDINTQHGFAHDFGGALFDVEGIDGTTVCDSNYGFGCYHQFFLNAVAYEGLDVLTKLDEACIEKNGFGGQGCQHGIGHGLLQYFGHSRLNDALQSCSTLQWQEPLFGCKSGVFMEYNFPTLIEGVTEEDAGNQFDERRPYDPCFSVPEKFQYTCLYTLPMWWSLTVELPYPEMGQLCEGIHSQYYSDICYKGIARVAVQTKGFDPDVAIDLCEQMPSKRGEIICKSGAAWAFWDSEFSHQFKKPCETLEGQDRTLCEQETDPLGEVNLFEYERFPEQ